MDPDGSSMLLGAIIFAAALFVRGCFTVCETALTEITDVKVRGFKDSEDKMERRLYALLKKPLRLITTFSALRILTAVLLAYIAFIYFYPPLNGSLEKYTAQYSSIIAAVIIIILLSVSMTVVTDGVPRRVTALGKDNFSEKTALRCASLAGVTTAVLTPVTALSVKLITVISSLFGIDSDAEKELVTEENILMMVDAGNESGVIEETQKEMINNVFEFGDLPVSDVMTHRTEMTAASADIKISDLVYLAINSGFSRIPVYRESIDHIIGIVCVKDLLCLVGRDNADTMSVNDFIRDVMFFPESGMCSDLFKQMTSGKTQIAVIVDEYGGTAGIVSVEDLVESIVGNIRDEFDNETEDIIKISDTEYTVSGTADPEEIMEALGCPIPEDSGFDTMSGLFIHLLGGFPEDGTTPSVTYKNICFTALIVEDMMIERLKAEITDKKPSEEKDKLNEERSDENEE